MATNGLIGMNSIVLKGQLGDLWLWGERGFSRQQGERWAPWIKYVKLTEGVQLAANPVAFGPLTDLPAGPYTLAIILTESETTEVIAKTQADFVLEP